MKLGLIARSENRGLGILTKSFYDAMHPAKTLHISPVPTIARGFVQHAGWYPDATVVPWDGGHLNDDLLAEWIGGLDVIYSAETWYDPRIPDIARGLGVATVQHVMPEFHNADLPQPTEIWLPTSWRADVFDSPRIMPVPVTVVETGQRASTERLRVLHVVGHRAMADRNGTLTFLQALRMVREPVEARLICQDRRAPKAQGVSPRVKYTSIVGPQESLSAQFEWADVVVMPRRYGGLCLPVQEAMAHGVPCIMPDVSPNQDWPVMLLPCDTSVASITTAAGVIPLAHVNPRHIAAAIDTLATDRELLTDLTLNARAWADAHGWEALKPVYEQAFADVVSAVPA